jgi:phosphoglycolate phosphatase
VFEMTQEFELLVFDWDGTLMDSVEHIASSLAAAATDIGMEDLGQQRYRDIIGLGLKEAMQALYPQAGEAETLALCERYRYHYVEASRVKSDLFAGALEMLHVMRNKGLKLAVATGKARIGLDRVFADTGYGELFHASRCSDESGSKPQPHMLNELMQELNVDAGKTLMIGDTEYDMAMARNAGTHGLAVSYGVHNCERLHKHKPLACLASMDELSGWLHAHTS